MKTFTTIKTKREYTYEEMTEIISERRVMMIDMNHFVVHTADLDFLENYINFNEVMEFNGVSVKGGNK